MKSLVYSLLFTLLQDLLVIVAAEPECNKRIESTDTRKSGIFSSEKYPSLYHPGVTCEYLFVAQGPERVQLNFTHMDLHYTGADASDPFSCENQDRVTVYVQLENEDWHTIDTYCGKQVPRVMMSTGHQMKVIFISESSSKESGTGFRLQYHFRTDYAITGTGVQDQRKVCTFMFRSRVRKHGYFTSPNYGGRYPRNTECQYIFFGRRNERVEIHFPVFEVDGIVPRCEVRTDSDRVSFSNFEDSKDTLLPTYCGIQPRDDFITSDGAFFKVTFKSNEKYDAKGFVGKYTFISIGDQVTTTQRPVGSASSSPSISTVFIATFLLLSKTVITISL